MIGLMKALSLPSRKRAASRDDRARNACVDEMISYGLGEAQWLGAGRR